MWLAYRYPHGKERGSHFWSTFLVECNARWLCVACYSISSHLADPPVWCPRHCWICNIYRYPRILGMVWHLFRMHTQEGEIFHWSSCTIHPLEVCQTLQLRLWPIDSIYLQSIPDTGKPSSTHLKRSPLIRATKSVVFWAAHQMCGTLGILTSALSIESIKMETKRQSNIKCASHSFPLSPQFISRFILWMMTDRLSGPDDNLSHRVVLAALIILLCQKHYDLISDYHPKCIQVLAPRPVCSVIAWNS